MNPNYCLLGERMVSKIKEDTVNELPNLSEKPIGKQQNHAKPTQQNNKTRQET